jgi:hypothetical protein
MVAKQRMAAANIRGYNMNIFEWAKEYLSTNGFTVTEPPEHVRTTPWSSVTRFITSNGYVYLKQTPPSLSLESVITQILYNKFHANVPVVIAANRDLHCFLMKDTGNPLRELFKSGFQVDLLCQGIEKYSYIQHAAAGNISLFIDLGVPDWRLKKLPVLYEEFINKKNLLIADGITNDELDTLHRLSSTFSIICEKLSSYKIPETLDHCDFHDNNILIEDGTNNITIIDLGETVITHPFFSIITCLRNAMFRYSFKEADKTYIALQDTCFKSWLEFESKNHLSEAMILAKRLWPIYAALGEYRLMTSTNKEEFKSLNRRGLIAMGFKEFIVRETTI